MSPSQIAEQQCPVSALASMANPAQWSRSIGLPSSPLSFQDLFSLDAESLSFVPKPVKAVLLLFPSRGELAAAREQEEKDGEGVWKGDSVWWIKQTVSSDSLIPLYGRAWGITGLIER